jgi:hypothetical protein
MTERMKDRKIPGVCAYSSSPCSSSCSSRFSSKVPQPIVSEVGLSSAAGIILILVRAYSAVAIVVPEMKSERALVPEGVCRMVRTFKRAFWCSLRSLLRVILWSRNSGQLRRRCFGV